MALADAVQGARHIAQEITWKDEDGNAVDLTGAVISGTKTSMATNVVTALDGELDATDAENGVFTWTYGANDVGTAGDYEVQFTATYGEDDLDRTLLHEWTVHPARSAS